MRGTGLMKCGRVLGLLGRSVFADGRASIARPYEDPGSSPG